jgi:hypothetical protein
MLGVLIIAHISWCGAAMRGIFFNQFSPRLPFLNALQLIHNH